MDKIKKWFKKWHVDELKGISYDINGRNVVCSILPKIEYVYYEGVATEWYIGFLFWQCRISDRPIYDDEDLIPWED